MAAELLSSGESGHLHGFLKKFAISVDKDRLERTLPKVQRLLKNQKKAKPGYSMQVLLQELDKIVDLRLAQEMEQLFFERSIRNN